MEVTDKLREIKRTINLYNLFIGRVQKIVNNLVDISKLQEKYRAPGGRVVMFDFYDLHINPCLMIHGGRITTVHDREPDGVVHIKFNPYFIDIVRGKTRATISKGKYKGKRIWVPYNPMKAVAAGHVRLEGDSYLSDLQLFNELYELFPDIKREILKILPFKGDR